ncbi:MAG: MFS transporter, partial [Salinigranum sp.]
MWATIRNQLTSARREITSDRSLGVLVFGGFARDLTRYGILTFVPLFAVQFLHASYFQAGLVLSVRGVSRLVFAPLAGRVTARYSRKRALVGALGVSTASVLFMGLAPSVL